MYHLAVYESKKILLKLLKTILRVTLLLVISYGTYLSDKEIRTEIPLSRKEKQRTTKEIQTTLYTIEIDRERERLLRYKYE